MTKSIFLQRLSATVQFILGFVLGISLIAGVSGTLIFAYYKKMSVSPKKPVFSGVPSPESVLDSTQESDSIEPIESNVAESEVEFEPKLEAKPEPEAEPKSEIEPEPEPEPEPELPPNAYRAEVTWPEGLSLRAEPSVNSDRVGGIAFEDNIVILEDSADGKWQRVRVPWSEQEGWVKAGNVQRTSN